MARVAIQYECIGVAVKGVGLTQSFLTIGIAGEGCVPSEIYRIEHMDAEKTTLVVGFARTPKGGLDLLGFPRDLRDKVVRFATPGGISFDSEADNRIDVEVFKNDGQLTGIFKYTGYIKGMWLWNPTDLEFEGVAQVYDEPDKDDLFHHMFRGPVNGDECLRQAQLGSDLERRLRTTGAGAMNRAEPSS